MTTTDRPSPLLRALPWLLGALAVLTGLLLAAVLLWLGYRYA